MIAATAAEVSISGECFCAGSGPALLACLTGDKLIQLCSQCLAHTMWSLYSSSPAVLLLQITRLISKSNAVLLECQYMYVTKA